MLPCGGILGEKKIGTKPDPPFFPARNRIIAGLSDIVIVVEAGYKGGALITAEIANNYDREVAAVPGNLGRPNSEGCNRLIKKHTAHIYTEIEDIEQIMNWDLDNRRKKDNLSTIKSDLSEEELIVVNLLSENQAGLILDELSWRSQISISKIASVLLNLEFKGIIRLLPGKKYVMNK